jgi:hypothetical protein
MMFLQVTLTAAYVTTCLRSPAMSKPEASNTGDECYRQHPSNKPIFVSNRPRDASFRENIPFSRGQARRQRPDFDLGKVLTSAIT